MSKRFVWALLASLMIVLLVAAQCGAAPATTAPEQPASSASAAEKPTEPPASSAPASSAAPASSSEPAKAAAGPLKVAFVYVGPVGDGGWTYAHHEGLNYLKKTLGDKVETAYLESVPEGADAEREIRNFAQQGYKLIVTTSFGFMDPTEAVAKEFPDTYFVHISGYKKLDPNFSDLMGAMEDMKYIAGMVAGARAKADGSKLVGYIAPFPIPEVIRLGNGIALGMKQTCPECKLQILWINSWVDPAKEREAAESLLDAGADVVITGADTPGPLVAAEEKGKWAIGYDSRNQCSFAPKACLGVPYWNWGPVYVKIAQSVMDGTFKAEDMYPDADSGIVGFYGFMEGETPQAGVPKEVIPQVQEVLAKMKSGEMTRFDIFKGPITDNQGKVVVPDGVKLTQSDLEGLKGVPGREDCTICMNWLADNIIGELPK